MTIQQPKEFSYAYEAKAYRYTHNTGGWIFAPAHGDFFPAILFPADMSPADIKRHALVANREGELLGSM